jgi:hypothetical protein
MTHPTPEQRADAFERATDPTTIEWLREVAEDRRRASAECEFTKLHYRCKDLDAERAFLLTLADALETLGATPLPREPDYIIALDDTTEIHHFAPQEPA